jgi:hypothetical protein
MNWAGYGKEWTWSLSDTVTMKFQVPAKILTHLGDRVSKNFSSREDK